MFPGMSSPSLTLATSLVALWAVASGSLVLAADDDWKAHFASHLYRSPAGGSLPYRLMSPAETEENATYPLVLFLHGAGERGDDNERQLVHVVGDLATDAMRQRHPAFVVAPQCAEDHKWVEVDWSAPSHTMPAEPSLHLRMTLELLDKLTDSLPVDPNRIYIVGLSMGGYGTWDALQREADRFAAAIPICGGGDLEGASAMAAVPIWAFHGDQDTAVPVERSRGMIRALRAAGAQPIYTEYEGVGHNSWAITASNRLTWDWLFSHVRPPAREDS